MKFTLLANRDEVHIGASLAPRRTDPGGRVQGQCQTLLPRLPRSARVGAGEATLLAPEVAAVLLLAPRSGDGLFARPLGAPLFCRVGNWIGSVRGTKQPTLPPSLAPTPAASECWRPQWPWFVARPRSGNGLVARP